jgi:hypothetical protein
MSEALDLSLYIEAELPEVEDGDQQVDDWVETTWTDACKLRVNEMEVEGEEQYVVMQAGQSIFVNWFRFMISIGDPSIILTFRGRRLDSEEWNTISSVGVAEEEGYPVEDVILPLDDEQSMVDDEMVESEVEVEMVKKKKQPKEEVEEEEEVQEKKPKQKSKKQSKDEKPEKKEKSKGKKKQSKEEEVEEPKAKNLKKRKASQISDMDIDPKLTKFIEVVERSARSKKANNKQQIPLSEALKDIRKINSEPVQFYINGKIGSFWKKDIKEKDKKALEPFCRTKFYDDPTKTKKEKLEAANLLRRALVNASVKITIHYDQSKNELKPKYTAYFNTTFKDEDLEDDEKIQVTGYERASFCNSVIKALYDGSRNNADVPTKWEGIKKLLTPSSGSSEGTFIKDWFPEWTDRKKFEIIKDPSGKVKSYSSDSE